MYRNTNSTKTLSRLLAAAAPLAAALLATAPAAAQTAVSIDEINAGAAPDPFVEVEGVWVADVDGVRLWTSRGKSDPTHPFAFSQRLHVTDGPGMPLDPESLLYAEVRVTGMLTMVMEEFPLAGDQLVGSISITGLELLTPPPPAAPPFPLDPGGDGGVADACDNCHFVLIICGFDQADYWNDAVQKYNYKKNNANVCPDNIVMLFKGGSNATGTVPNGTTGAGGAFTSGGCFDCNKANVDKAFAYFQAKMAANNCTSPRLQVHSTGHGGGYDTTTQFGQSEAGGWAGGRLDTSGDENDNIADNDLKFNADMRGTFDLDGDGNSDLLFQVTGFYIDGFTIKAEVTVWHDRNGDGTVTDAEKIGTDTNHDGRIDKDDANWNAPDLDRNAGTNTVSFDETLLLGGSEVLTDDELKAKIQNLQNNTTLTAAKTQIELAQCYSGGFNADCDSVAGEQAYAAAEGERSYSYRGNNGYNIYEKPFIQALADGKTWPQAHAQATTAVNAVQINGAGLGQTPEFDANSNPGPNPCPSDTNGDGLTDIDDLVAVVLDFGTDGAINSTDIDGNGIVDVDDIVEVVLGWGACPQVEPGLLVLQCPQDQFLPCSMPPDPQFTGEPFITGGCEPITLWFDDTVEGDGCNLVIQRMWTAFDDCGDMIDCMQLIFIDQ